MTDQAPPAAIQPGSRIRAATGPGHPPTRLLASEWRKLRATPAMWWLLAGVLVLEVAATVSGFAGQPTTAKALTSALSLRKDLQDAATGALLVAVAGIMGMAGEFRHGQADQTFITEPRRHRVVTAKLTLFGAAGIVFGAAACAVNLTALVIWVAGHHAALNLGQGVIWQIAAGQVATAALFAVLGVAVGALARNQVVAIVIAFCWFMMLEPLVMSASTRIGRWLPGEALRAITQSPQPGVLPAAAGAAVLAGWAAAALAAGYWRTITSDIT